MTTQTTETPRRMTKAEAAKLRRAAAPRLTEDELDAAADARRSANAAPLPVVVVSETDRAANAAALRAHAESARLAGPSTHPSVTRRSTAAERRALELDISGRQW